MGEAAVLISAVVGGCSTWHQARALTELELAAELEYAMKLKGAKWRLV